MRNRSPIRRLIVPVALLLLLVVGMTLCNVLHHHAGSTDANCSICHLNHQAIDQPLPADSTTAKPIMAALGSTTLSITVRMIDGAPIPM